MGRVGFLPERGLGRLEGADLALHLDELDPDLLHLLLGDGKGLADPPGVRALVGLLLLQLRDLGRPRLDLLLALDEELADLLAAPLHLAEALVEDLDLLAALGELEPRLRQGLALHVALGAHRDEAALDVLDPLALRRGGGLRLRRGRPSPSPSAPGPRPCACSSAASSCSIFRDAGRGLVGAACARCAPRPGPRRAPASRS